MTLPSNATALQENVSKFRKHGYVLVEGLLSTEEVADWRELAKEDATADDRYIVGGLIERRPSLAFPLAARPRLLDLAEALTGPFVQLDSLSLVGNPPLTSTDKGSGELHWHRDPYGHVPISGGYEHPLTINVLCYLQRLDRRVGPLRVIPGSHRAPLVLHPRFRTVPHPEETTLFLGPGDAVMLHNNLVHSRSPNNSDVHRLYLSVLYNRSYMKTTLDTSGPRIQELLAKAERRNDRRIMRLLGLDALLDERCNSGFLTMDEEMWTVWIEEDRRALL